jgi:hypothetical protein
MATTAFCPFGNFIDRPSQPRKFLDGVAVEAQDPVKSVSDMVDKVAGR